jgi:hypothetical protein
VDFNIAWLLITFLILTNIIKSYVLELRCGGVRGSSLSKGAKTLGEAIGILNLWDQIF